MRKPLLLSALLVATLAACQDVTAPEQPAAEPEIEVMTALQGPSNLCYGEIVSGISSTWPFAHLDHSSFAPPRGAIAKWIDEFGAGAGISSVRELQVLFCTPV